MMYLSGKNLTHCAFICMNPCAFWISHKPLHRTMITLKFSWNIQGFYTLSKVFEYLMLFGREIHFLSHKNAYFWSMLNLHFHNILFPVFFSSSDSFSSFLRPFWPHFIICPFFSLLFLSFFFLVVRRLLTQKLPLPLRLRRFGCVVASWRTSLAPGWDTSTGSTFPTRSQVESAWPR